MPVPSASASYRPAVVAAAMLVGPQVAAKATRDALFLSQFPVSSLPAMTATAAVVSLVGTLAFSRAMARLSPARLLPVAVAASAGLFAAEWGLALSVPRTAAVLLYLHHALLAALLVSGFWSLVSESFDPHRARQAMGAIGTGASLGGVAGGLLAWGIAAMAGAPTMLAVLAALSLFALASLVPLIRVPPHGGPQLAGWLRRGPTPAAVAANGATASGLALIRAMPYLRGLAVLVALCAFVEAVLDYLLGAAATAALGRGRALMSFYALLHSVTGLVALALQALAVRPLLTTAGLTATLALLPAFTAAATGLSLFIPRLGPLVVVRGGESVLRNSAFRSAYELLFAPLPAERKRPTKVILDVACDRAGTVLGSAAVALVVLVFHEASPRPLLALALVGAAASMVMAPRFHRGYVAALAETLRAGAPALEPAAVVDPTTLLTLASVHRDLPGAPHAQAPPAAGTPDDPLVQAIADLRSGEAVRIAAALSAYEGDARLLPHLVLMLGDDGLFALAAGALRRAGRRCTGQLVDALLDRDIAAPVRRRVARVLKTVPTQRAADGLLLALDDERFDIRYRAAEALVRIRGDNADLVLPAARIVEIAAREARDASRSPRHLEHVFDVLSLVLDRRPLEIALKAVRGSDAPLRGTALEYLDNVLPPAVRERLWPSLGQPERPTPTGRSPEQIRDDLLRSQT